jgi:ankyrin repeat protein
MTSIVQSDSSKVNHKELAEAELAITRRLMEGCGAGDVATLRTILYDELDENDAASRIEKARDANGKTLVHFASATGQSDVVRFLHSSMLSAARGDVLLNQRDNEGSTSISSACGAAPRDKVLSVVQTLLELGADPTIMNHNGVGPLHRAAGEGHADILGLLLQSGSSGSSSGSSSKARAAVDDTANEGGDTGTAVHWIASRGKLECLQVLIEAGANLNARNAAGLVPVLVAAAAGSGRVVAGLVQAGADTNVELPGGVTLLHVCAVRIFLLKNLYHPF